MIHQRVKNSPSAPSETEKLITAWKTNKVLCYRWSSWPNGSTGNLKKSPKTEKPTADWKQTQFSKLQSSSTVSSDTTNLTNLPLEMRKITNPSIKSWKTDWLLSHRQNNQLNTLQRQKNWPSDTSEMTKITPTLQHSFPNKHSIDTKLPGHSWWKADSFET